MFDRPCFCDFSQSGFCWALVGIDDDDDSWFVNDAISYHGHTASERLDRQEYDRKQDSERPVGISYGFGIISEGDYPRTSHVLGYLQVYLQKSVKPTCVIFPKPFLENFPSKRHGSEDDCCAVPY